MTNRRLNSHLFWGTHSPLSSLSGAALLVMSTGRFAFALICAGAIVWVYGLTALIYSNARRIMPLHGKKAVLLFLSAFLCGIFALFLNFLNPLLAMSAGFFLVLIPPYCLGTGLFEFDAETGKGGKDANHFPQFSIDIFSRALLEAAVFGGIILGIALIREPLGMGTLSFPGGEYGIVEISGGGETFITLKILSVSSGGILLFGYGIALYRYFKERSGLPPEDQ